MTYELAKQLKEAGFPQPDLDFEGERFLMRENADNREGEYDAINDRTMWIKYFNAKYVKENLDLVVYVPTLSELIEACIREGYFDFHLGQHGEDWESSIVENTNNKSLLESTVLEHGTTPEEAVAKLWFALKKSPSQE